MSLLPVIGDLDDNPIGFEFYPQFDLPAILGIGMLEYVDQGFFDSQT